ncbi:MAG: hypothetical protein JXB45_07245 [Candidatus Krumholzibacteriota bacterium]|nr:hypothetical protein [Candidatus Krumholzibacteriota bacterium]
MRITFQMLSKGPLRNIQSSLERYSNLNIKAGSMKNFRKPSDDPLGLRKAMGFKTLLRQNAVYNDNANNAGMFLDMTDSTLLSIKGIIDSAKSLALEMRNSTADAGDVRTTAAGEVDSIITDVKNLLNTKFHNKYLFGGYLVDTEPFAEINDHIEYVGDDNVVQLRVGPNSMMDATIPGSRFLALGEAQRSISSGMHASLESSSLLDQLNDGLGVYRGQIRITNGSGVSVDLDLSGCQTIQDVVDAIDSSGIGIISGYNSVGGITLLDLGGVGELTVEDLNGGSTAADLGILGSSSGQVLAGTALHPLLTRDSSINGIDLLQSVGLSRMLVNINGNSYEVDFAVPTYPVTLGDLLDQITQTVPDLRAEINDSGDGIVLISDFPFSIEEIGGGTTAADLGLEGASAPFEPYSLFGTLEDFRQALLDDNADALDAIIGELQFIIDHILEIEAEVGARGQQVDLIKNQLLDSRVSLEENLSLVEDVDLSVVLTELAEAQLAYEAALQTAASIYNLSLLNYDR